MATEEKKPETEAARAQPTPSSSAAQSKASPWGHLGCRVLDGFKPVSLSSPLR